jgi:hypothetical protein
MTREFFSFRVQKKNGTLRAQDLIFCFFCIKAKEKKLLYPVAKLDVGKC